MSRYLIPLIALAAVVATAGCATGSGAPSEAPTSPPVSAPSAAAPAPPLDLGASLSGLEARYGARLGVYAVDTGSEAEIAHRADDRFAYASTLKILLAALLLDTGAAADLERAVPIPGDAAESYSPVTGEHAGGTLTARELADAAARFSDNTAANLLFELLGGPAAVEERLRAIGDHVTEVDRVEPDLNEATPGDVRDTTTPRAFAADLRRFAVDDGLEPAAKGQLVEWLRGNTTGNTLVRAGAPAGWVVGDRSGAAGYGTRNDAAVLWPGDGGAPIVLVVMSAKDAPGATADDALIADATRAVTGALRR